MTITPDLYHALEAGEHADPFSVLGMHVEDGALTVRALLPGAASVTLLDAASGAVIMQLPQHGSLFEGVISGRDAPFPYRLRVDWHGHIVDQDDAYRFPSQFGDIDAWLLAEGTHRRPYERMGAQLATIDGVAGVCFAVWAPNARSRVAVRGRFQCAGTAGSHADAEASSFRPGCGRLFVPGIGAGDACTSLPDEDPVAADMLVDKCRSLRLLPGRSCRRGTANGRAPTCRQSQVERLGVPDSVPVAAQRARRADFGLYEDAPW